MRSSSRFEMEMNSWLPRVLSCLGDWSGPVSMRLQVAFLLSLHLRSALSCGLLWPPVASRWVFLLLVSKQAYCKHSPFPPRGLTLRDTFNVLGHKILLQSHLLHVMGHLAGVS